MPDSVKKPQTVSSTGSSQGFRRAEPGSFWGSGVKKGEQSVSYWGGEAANNALYDIPLDAINDDLYKKDSFGLDVGLTEEQKKNNLQKKIEQQKAAKLARAKRLEEMRRYKEARRANQTDEQGQEVQARFARRQAVAKVSEKSQPKGSKMTFFLALIIAIFKDILDMTVVLALPGIGTVLTICFWIAILFVCFIGGNLTLVRALGFLLFLPVEALFFGFNLLPITIGLVITFFRPYYIEKK